MPRRTPGGLKGGRALYRGPNSYASQGFENDTRKSQLGGLLIAYLYGNLALTPSVETTIPFAAYASRLYRSVFLRSFMQLSSNDGFVCRSGGTYRINLGLETYSGPVAAYVKVTRDTDQFSLLARSASTSDTGTIYPFGGSTIPSGTLPCDGSAVSRTTYANLFAVIGTTWGVGDGSTTFNVPDLRGRAIIGSGTGSGLTARTLGTQNIGSETMAHTHDAGALVANISSGATVLSYQDVAANFTRTDYVVATGYAKVASATSVSNGTQVSGTSAGASNTDNMQPSAVCNWVIRTGASEASSTQTVAQDWIVDLQFGDVIQLVINPGPGSPILVGSSTSTSASDGLIEAVSGTKLLVEQIDLPSPAWTHLGPI